MTEQVLADQKLWFAGYDLTGAMNALNLDYSAELQDSTTFGADTRERLGGLKLVTAQHEGYFEGEVLDQALYARIALADVPMSFAPRDALEGAPAYTFQAVLGEYTPGGALGEMFGFSLGAEASGSLIRGTLGANRAAIAASGNAAGFNIGAIAAGQSLYAALHILAVDDPGDTLDVIVESDDGVGFATPTTRFSFAQAGAIGSEWAVPVPGPIADDWWRVRWTVTGVTPAFGFAVILGIQ